LSFLYVMEYIGGLVLFGLGYWLLDGIKIELESTSSVTDVFTLANYVWTGIIVIYIIFGGIWLARRYNEKSYGGKL